MSALDQLSNLIIGAGTPGAIMIPLLPGSEYSIESPTRAAPLATNQTSPVNTMTGQSLPWFYVRARAYSNWFTPAAFGTLFGRSNGRLGSWGAARWKKAGKTPVQFAAVKCDTMAIHWGGGEALLVEMILRPYGWRMNPTTLTLSPPFGPAWPSMRTTYTNLSGVAGGTIRLDNGLAPKSNTPHYSSIDGQLYPVEFTNEALATVVSLTQKSDAGALDTGGSTSRYSFSIHFHDLPGTHRVSFACEATPPGLKESLMGGLSRSERSYEGVQPTLYTPLVYVSGA